MKTKLIIPALFVVGLCGAPMIASANTITPLSIEFTQEKEKVKIENDKLPQPIQDAIKKDNKSSQAEIKEAWQVMGEDGKVYYAVKFDHNGEEFSKKYDAEGNEKKDN